MSSKGAAERIGEMVGKARERADNLKADTKKAGLLTVQMGELADAKGIMADVMLFATNQTVSIDDRVAKMDMMLVLLNALPKAKPDNGLWDEAYTGHRGLMQFWTIFKSQRFFFSDYAVAEIEEFTERKEEKVNDKGERKMETVRGWNARTVDPTTALEMYLSQPEGDPNNPVRGNVNILRTIRQKSSATFEDMAFSKEFSEECVTSFGDIVMVQSILLLLNYAFNEFNVPVNTLLLIQSMIQSQGGLTHLDVRTKAEEPVAS